MNTEQKTNKINFKLILIVISILAIFIIYWYQTKDTKDEAYQIKAAGSAFGYKQTYINRTGKDVEDKKIELSDEYWKGGKFSF